jgi:hypothetical protein
MPVVKAASGVFARSRRRLSASSSVTWNRCSRDWFLTRRMGMQVPAHPEMILGHVIEEGVIRLLMHRIPNDPSIADIDALSVWLLKMVTKATEEAMADLRKRWKNHIWTAEERDIEEIDDERVSTMLENGVKMQIEVAKQCLQAGGGPHLEAFRRDGDPFGTPAPCWDEQPANPGEPAGRTAGDGWAAAGEPCTLWEAWEIARPWMKDPRVDAAQRLYHPERWAAGELDVAHRWSGNVEIVDIKANKGKYKNLSGVATQLRFYQWLWYCTRTHEGRTPSRVEEGAVTALKSWHMADAFLHEADLIPADELDAEGKKLRELHQKMTAAGISDLCLDADSPSEDGLLPCPHCHGHSTCDYPRAGAGEHPMHSLLSDTSGMNPVGPPFAPIGELPSRVNIRGRLHGHWGPLPNHFGEGVCGAAVTAGEKTAVIEEMGVGLHPNISDSNGDVVISGAAPGQWRGMVRFYLDSRSEIFSADDAGDLEVTRLGLVPTRANVAGMVVSRGATSGVGVNGRQWSMSIAHIWDGTGLVEVVAFGRGRSESFDALRVGNEIRLVAAELGWREGIAQLRIDPRNTRLTVESKPPSEAS